MSLRVYRFAQLALMASLALFLGWRIVTGEVFFYINERFLPLIAVAALTAAALAYGAWAGRAAADVHGQDDVLPGDVFGDMEGAGARQRAAARSRAWRFGLVSIPLLLGVLIPAAPLGSSAIDNRGLNADVPLSAGGGSQVRLEIAPEERSILDWVRAINYAGDPSEVRGLPADVVGFVYRVDSLAEDQFMVARFMVTCCSADAQAVAAIVTWPDGGALTDNTWVRVRGTIGIGQIAGQSYPLITAASVEPTEQPEHPYMYP
jgi:uncharacterized repeat protein (TIGR03943 family)